MSNKYVNLNNQNFINYGYGYAYDIKDNIENQSYSIYPVHQRSHNIARTLPISLLPFKIAPDEVYTYVSESILPNNCNRYIVSNYGRFFDLFLNKFVPYRYNLVSNHPGRLYLHLSHYRNYYELESVDASAHRVTLQSFVYNPEFKDLEVDHINGIFTDNRICNLEWVTSAENMRRSRITGLNANIGNKLLEQINGDDVRRICELFHKGYNIYDIANTLDIKRVVVRDILCGFYYSEITSKSGVFNNIALNLPDEGVEIVCDLISQGIPISQISTITGVTKYQILDIIERRSYVYISKYYNFINANDNYRRELTQQEVYEICRRLSIGDPPKAIADDIGIADNIVKNIKAGKIYTEVSSLYGEFSRINREFLSDEIVNNICIDMQSGLRNVDIMKKYNLGNTTVSKIRSGFLYKHITSNYNLPKSEDLPKDRYLSDDTVRQICEMLSMGETPTNIANKFGIETGRVNNIKSRDSYKDISKDYVFPRISKDISDDQVRIVCQGLQEKWRLRDILNTSNISKRSVYLIRDRKSHTDISKDYIW